MIHIFMILYIIVLFFVLTPGILITLPDINSSKYVITATHGLIFAIIFQLTHKMTWYIFYGSNSIIRKMRNNVKKWFCKD